MKVRKGLTSAITVIFFGIVAYLLSRSLSDVNWDEAWASLDSLSWRVVAVAGPIVAFNFGILASFDYLGLRYIHSPLSAPKVFWSAFISYVFNLNLGALVGGVAMRFRIYSRWKIPPDKISQVFIFSTLTNWLGYTFLLSLFLLFRGEDVARLVGVSGPLMKSFGALGLVLVGSYFIFSWRRSELRVKGRCFRLPPIKLAALQLFLACLQWLSLSGLLTIILHGLGAGVRYGDVLFTHLTASIIGALTHIPGGLGVLETVFLRMGLSVNKGTMVVALICFRLLYYLIPLSLAIPGYFSLELFQRGRLHSLKKQTE